MALHPRTTEERPECDKESSTIFNNLRVETRRPNLPATKSCHVLGEAEAVGCGVVISVNTHARTVVSLLLEDIPAAVAEATVRLPPRSRRWVAVYTGQEPGVQVARSTGLTDRQAALDLARRWEAEARQRRARLRNRLGIGPERIEPGGLSQELVGALLGISPRTVRAIERRAVRKLRQHPVVRQMWKEFGESDVATPA